MEKTDLQSTIEKYAMPPEATKLLREHPPLIICGVTGAGKDTIARYLMQSGNYAHVVSHTSRASRPHLDGHEVNGVDYWFIDNAQALEMLRAQKFVEAELVHGKDTLYGTSIEAYRRVTDNHKVPLLEIDIKGVLKLQSQEPSLMAIFLVPPDFQTWLKRVRGRGNLSEEELRKRLSTAIDEFRLYLDNDNFIPIVNTEVADTAQAIEDGSYKDPVSIEIAHTAVQQLLHDTQRYLEAA